MFRVRRALSRASLQLLTAALALAACTSSVQIPHSAPPVRPADGRPNIVFVLTDDLSTNLVPYMPHVQALMRRGMTFRNYFVVDSLCCPSRSAIFTGEYPHNDGVFTNAGKDGGYDAYNRFGNPPKSFAVALQKAGYVTGFMGKYLNRYETGDAPAPGWGDWVVGADSAYNEYNYDLNENGTDHKYGDQPHDYLTNVLDHAASRFIDQARTTGKPLALEVATYAPHHPWVPARTDINTFQGLRAPRGPTFDRHPTGAPAWLALVPKLTAKNLRHIDRGFERRVEAVQSVDRMIGHLERKLASEHMLDNTYFVFSSDNGFHMGEHGLWPGKQTAFDTDIRVPLVIAGPGVPAGRTVDAIASSIDLAPTFLDIASAQPTGRPDGVSLLPLLHGDPPASDWQRAALVEHHGDGIPRLVGPDRQPVEAGRPPNYEAVRTADWLYVEYTGTGAREYYDLKTDPDEMHNIADTLSQQRLAELHQIVRALETCKGATECQRAASLRYPSGARR